MFYIKIFQHDQTRVQLMLPQPLQTRVSSPFSFCHMLLKHLTAMMQVWHVWLEFLPQTSQQRLNYNDAGMTCVAGMRTPIPSWEETPLWPASLLVINLSVYSLVFCEREMYLWIWGERLFQVLFEYLSSERRQALPISSDSHSSQVNFTFLKA